MWFKYPASASFLGIVLVAASVVFLFPLIYQDQNKIGKAAGALIVFVPLFFVGIGFIVMRTCRYKIGKDRFCCKVTLVEICDNSSNIKEVLKLIPNKRFRTSTTYDRIFIIRMERKLRWVVDPMLERYDDFRDQMSRFCADHEIPIFEVDKTRAALALARQQGGEAYRLSRKLGVRRRLDRL
jgi:hypothetical protein